MSEVKHSLRLMIIDIEEDKILVDEFCDSVIAGLAQSREAMPPQKIEIAASKSGYIEGIFAVEAAESAIRTQKKKIIKTFIKNAPSEVVEEVLGSDAEVEDE